MHFSYERRNKMYQIIKMILLSSIFMDYIDIQKLDKNEFTIHIIEIMLVLSLINGIINLYDEKKFFIIEFLMIILFHLAGNKIILENILENFSFFWQSIKLIGVYILHLLITTDVGMDDNNINPFSKIEWTIVSITVLIFLLLMLIFNIEINSLSILSLYCITLFELKGIFINITEYIENQKKIEKENRDKWQK
ncbi:hypothetical protein GCWU000323_00619 [Leptotrichia hofstadii F0254]|uniref:Uncharacterized protein n=2 Tax=Leptotrichia hofstadii TaxID=157688 RepID=C9MVE8_9FUSO|nr:hypothetical protein GCWU000323_00619 [Leptotrichia hofstadii F0254]